MRGTLTEPQNRPYLIAAAILFIGLGSSVAIYLTAASVPDTIPEFSAESSKKYLRDLQLYGGTANVLAVEFMDWFNGLWHGRSLAFTVAVITLASCLGYLFFAVILPRPASDDVVRDDRQGRTPPA